MIDNTKPIQLIQNITDSDIKYIGKSLYILSKFFQERLPIPNGFIISSLAFNQYLEQTELQKYFSTTINNNPDKTSIKSIFQQSNLPQSIKDLIVETYSRMSGFSEAFVNIKGIIIDKNSNEISHRNYAIYDIKGENNLLNSIIELYSEIITDNNTIIDKFIDKELSIVISIHKSIQAEASGLMQTSDIITKDSNSLVIESLYGLESGSSMEGLVPDQYIFSKNTDVIKEKHISTQEFMLVRQPGSHETTQKVEISPAWQKRQKLDDKHIIVLAKTGIMIEEELKEPQIISWSYESGKIWITFVENLNKKTEVLTKSHNLQNEVNSQLVQTNFIEENNIVSSKNSLLDVVMDDISQLNTLNTNEITNLTPAEINKVPNLDKTIESKISQSSDQKLDIQKPLLEGAHGAGKEAQGEVTFNPETARENNILVLKGDEDISSNIKIAGFIVEEESNILAKRLNEYFQVPVITGVPLALKILKEGEIIKINGKTCEIFETIDNNASDNINEINTNSSNINIEDSNKTESLGNFGNKIEQKNQEDLVEFPFKPSILQKESEIDEIEIPTIPNIPEINSNINFESNNLDNKLPNPEDIIPNNTIKKKENLQKSLSHLLTLVNEDANEEVTEIANNEILTNSDEVLGVNHKDQIKVWGNSLERIITASNKIPSTSALNALEHVIEDAQENIQNSMEYNFDQEEQYISQKDTELSPLPTIKIEEFIPTATKVYAQLIDETLNDDFVNFDGIIFSSTYEPEAFLQLLNKTLDKAAGKDILVITPPYENEALEIFFKSIYKLRNNGNRNISLILPDYRNKKELIEYKKILSASGLRRSATFEILANISRTINVFRIEEINDDLVDGLYIDLFRLKMNMLGVEKFSASTKYVEGMKNLVQYIHENTNMDGRSLINISGFANPKNILNHLSKFQFQGVICDQNVSTEVKKIISVLERKALDINNPQLRVRRRRR